MYLLRTMLFSFALLQMHCINITDTLTGTVVDGNIGLPIPDAEIRLKLYDYADRDASGENPVVYTDNDGVYHWKTSGTMIMFQGGGNGFPEKAIITVTKTGYKTYTSPEYVKLSGNGIQNVKLVP